MKDINSLQQASEETTKAEMTAQMIQNVYLLKTEKSRDYFKDALLDNIDLFLGNINKAIKNILEGADQMDEEKIIEDSRLVLSGGNTSFPESQNSMPTTIIEATSNLIERFASDVKKSLENCINTQVAIAKGISEDSFSRLAYSKKDFQLLLIKHFLKQSNSIRSQLDALFGSLLTFDKQGRERGLDLSGYRNDIYTALERFNLMFAHISAIFPIEKSVTELFPKKIETKSGEDVDSEFTTEEAIALAN